MNVLFVCSLNKVRSLTAQHIFQKRVDLQVLSAGTQSNARVVISQKLIDWADIIFLMEKEHEEKLRNKYSEIVQKKQIVCLHIENGYEYMDEDLVEALKRATENYF